jgi:hypothetical protein
MTQEQEELFKADPIISLVLENNITSVKLVGGAVVDILEGRKVKDYDFMSLTSLEAEKLGFKYSHDTKTATTYVKDDFIIQVLKTDINDFDFKISQSTLSWNYKKEFNLVLDENSFNNKTLIPPNKSWEEKKNALNSLMRIPHWKNKGYTINDTTYLSLLGVVGKGNNYNS